MARIMKVTSSVCSLAVICLVGFVVLTTASLIVRKTIADEHSTFNMVGGYMDKRALIKTEYAQAAASKAYVDGAAPNSAAHEDDYVIVHPIIPEPVCYESLETVSARYKHSLVNYLLVSGVDFSLSYRTLLAKRYGIEGYNGTQSENERLLHTLFILQGEAKQTPCVQTKSEAGD